MAGTLSVVGTPIGNLEDISLRALRILKECDAVLCEDTRVTSKLLKHYELHKPLVSYHEHSGEAKYDKVLAQLGEGKHLALVSDAGMPTISDPGARLVDAVRRELPDVRIETVPGPSAVATALSVAGVMADAFIFAGFPPHKKGRKTYFEEIAQLEGTVVFYESPHRILKALEALVTNLTEGARVCVCRELTKMHEEVACGTPQEVLAHYTQHSDRVRGEFVVVVDTGAGK